MIMVKWKQSGKVDFFRKNLRIQVDRVLNSESHGGIFGSLAPFCAALTAYAKIFLENFFVLIGKLKNSTCTALVFIDFTIIKDQF